MQCDCIAIDNMNVCPELAKGSRYGKLSSVNN